MSNATATTTSVLSVEGAERATDRIRKCADNYAKARKALESAIKAARDGEAHTALGMSWPEYVAHTLEGVGARMAKVDKDALTVMMAGEGLSSRVVARVLCVSQSTANRMIKAAIESGELKGDRKVTGTDGVEQTADGRGRGRKGGESTGDAVSQGDSPAREVKTLSEVKTDDLLRMGLDLAAELNNRWMENGDTAAESAIADLVTYLSSLGE